MIHTYGQGGVLVVDRVGRSVPNPVVEGQHQCNKDAEIKALEEAQREPWSEAAIAKIDEEAIACRMPPLPFSRKAELVLFKLNQRAVANRHLRDHAYARIKELESLVSWAALELVNDRDPEEVAATLLSDPVFGGKVDD